MPARNMKNVIMISMMTLLYAPTLAVRVENPPVAMVANVWQKESNQFILPANLSSSISMRVRSAYTPQSSLAVVVIRGVRRSFDGPGISAR